MPKQKRRRTADGSVRHRHWDRLRGLDTGSLGEK
jgi:hypothetical protein